MAEQISKVKRQIQSIKSTQKLTNAMSLVSQSKLLRQRKRMEENRVYASQYQHLIKSIVESYSDEEGENENIYLEKRDDFDNPLHIIITSNSGLCGAYNSDMFKYIEEHISKSEAIFAIGTKGISWLMNHDYMVVKQFGEMEDLQPSQINYLIQNILTLYKYREISSLDIIYTQYVNTLTFRPTTLKVLPYEKDASESVGYKEMILEPSKEEVLDELFPQYISSVIYAALLEAKASEHGARRAAMDAANNNAKEMISTLTLKFNQARQGQVTQEVTEIIAGTTGV